MKSEKKLWISFALVMSISFTVLLYYGYQIYQQAPPIPIKVTAVDGEVLFTGQDIKDGQNVWQSMGGQEVGTVWGHGAYLAPDWTADWIHREAQFILNKWAEADFNLSFDQINSEQKAGLEQRLQNELRKNTFDSKTQILVISPLQKEVVNYLKNYYASLFTDDPKFDQLRLDYAIPKNTIENPTRMNQMTSFFFWAAWVCVTERPGESITYTHNWPPDEQVGNKPTGDLILLTGFSVIMLLMGIGIMIFYHIKTKREEDLQAPKEDPLMRQNITPSMKAVEKYFWIVNLLILFQVILGGITAHYGVEGNSFYGFPMADYFPYSVTRTWHVQLALFWIASTWLATGLYIAPSLSGKDPKFQKFGVNLLFYALLIIILGSMAGQWMGIMQKLGLVENFWFGHQGYEYVDLGRFWQLFLFAGFLIWLSLMVRPILPVLRKKTDEKHFLILFLISCTAIALFYGAGLMWGRQTNLSIAEYWRFWVVHLWVEGFFEVFATVVAAFLFLRMGLLQTKTATRSVLFATIIFLSGGILGTFHHLYFTGAPKAIMALGATFSALEVVPLVLIGFEAFRNYKMSKAAEWLKDYKWPIYYLLSVSFWNFFGAGILGFLINPPIALYYMQGLNTTAAHGHAALFGVYGMLGIGLMLFVLRSLYRNIKWNEKLLGFSFWSINLGLMLMVVLSLLPVGLLQTVACVNKGMWYARSAEFMQLPHMHLLKWLRIVGDIVFTVGTITLCWFVFDLARASKKQREL